MAHRSEKNFTLLEIHKAKHLQTTEQNIFISTFPEEFLSLTCSACDHTRFLSLCLEPFPIFSSKPVHATTETPHVMATWNL